MLTDTDLTRDEIAEVLDTAARLKKLRRAGSHMATWQESRSVLSSSIPAHAPASRSRREWRNLAGRPSSSASMTCRSNGGRVSSDTAQVLSRYVDGLVARVAAHADLEELAAASSVPVLNGLSDRCHPMQALSDLLTMREILGGLAGRKLAYLGDGNNMVHSLLLACAPMGVSVSVASPEHYQPDVEVVNHARWLAATNDVDTEIVVTDDPFAAVQGADVIYTDVHVSMGQSDEPIGAQARRSEWTMLLPSPG